MHFCQTSLWLVVDLTHIQLDKAGGYNWPDKSEMVCVWRVVDGLPEDVKRVLEIFFIQNVFDPTIYPSFDHMLELDQKFLWSAGQYVPNSLKKVSISE